MAQQEITVFEFHILMIPLRTHFCMTCNFFSEWSNSGEATSANFSLFLYALRAWRFQLVDAVSFLCNSAVLFPCADKGSNKTIHIHILYKMKNKHPPFFRSTNTIWFMQSVTQIRSFHTACVISHCSAWYFEFLFETSYFLLQYIIRS